MYRNSLDAIRSFLKKNFPDISKTYVNNVPSGFTRPSFFVELVTGTGEDLSRSMYQTRATWQIVYFAPKSQGGDVDAFDQLDVADQLQDKLRADLVLTSPDGIVYHILDADIGTRDTEVYCTLRLEREKNRPESHYDAIQTIDHDYKEG